MNIKYSKPQNFWVSVFNIKIILKNQFPILTVFAILKKKFSISWNIKKRLKNPGLQIAVPVTYETRMFYLRLSRALTRVKICLPSRTATVKHAFLVWAGRGETCFRMHEFGTGMKFARTVSGNTKVTDSILRTRMHSSCKTLTKILELPRYSTH